MYIGSLEITNRLLEIQFPLTSAESPSDVRHVPRIPLRGHSRRHTVAWISDTRHRSTVNLDIRYLSTLSILTLNSILFPFLSYFLAISVLLSVYTLYFGFLFVISYTFPLHFRDFHLQSFYGVPLYRSRPVPRTLALVIQPNFAACHETNYRILEFTYANPFVNFPASRRRDEHAPPLKSCSHSAYSSRYNDHFVYLYDLWVHTRLLHCIIAYM
jgi:hypothetical protein